MQHWHTFFIFAHAAQTTVTLKRPARGMPRVWQRVNYNNNNINNNSNTPQTRRKGSEVHTRTRRAGLPPELGRRPLADVARAAKGLALRARGRRTRRREVGAHAMEDSAPLARSAARRSTRTCMRT